MKLTIPEVTVKVEAPTAAGLPGAGFDPGVEAQVADTSPILVNFLWCVVENLPSGIGRISSISDSNNRAGTEGFTKCKTCPKGQKLPECAHTCQSCHYGGTGSLEKSYAVDFGDEENAMVIGSTVIGCATKLNIPQDSINFINEGDHLHYEINCPQ